MQINVQLELDSNVINLDYRRMFLSFLKTILEKENPDLYEQFYGEGAHFRKPFTFWAKLPGAKFLENSIEIEGNQISLYISSSDTKIILYLFNGMLKMKETKYPLVDAHYMQISHVKTQKVKAIQDNEIIVKMISPFVVRHHEKGQKDHYYCCGEEGFQQTIYENFITQLSVTEECVPKIEPIKSKKVIVKTMGIKIPANLGIYKITGDKHILQKIYLNGMLSRTSAGFGKFEVIG